MRARTQVPRTLVHSSSGTAGPASTLTLNLPTHYDSHTPDVTSDTPLVERSICPNGSPSRTAVAHVLTWGALPGCIAPFRERHHTDVALFTCLMEYR